MASFYFFLSLFLAYVSLMECARSKDPLLTPFGKKVKKYLPKKVYNKLYSVNIKNEDQLKEAVQKSYKQFFDILGAPFNQSLINKTEAEDASLGDNAITPELIFNGQTYGVYKGLMDKGLLNTKKNVRKLARKFADELVKVSKGLGDNEDIVTTLYAQSTAVATFLKSEGVTSDDNIKDVENAFNQELDEHENDSSD